MSIPLEIVKLRLPSLDNLLPTLQRLGKDARVFKVDIWHDFRNVPVDPADAIHPGMKWRGGLYLQIFRFWGSP